MKFQPDQPAGTNAITRIEPHRLWVQAQAYEHSIVVPWQGDVVAWHAENRSELTSAHFEQLLALNPDVVIFGSGPELKFVPPALYRALIDRRIGLETMDTMAACRTFNVLMHEGRKVVGALLLQAPAPAPAQTAG